MHYHHQTQADERLSWAEAIQWFGGSGAAEFLVSSITNTPT